MTGRFALAVVALASFGCWQGCDRPSHSRVASGGRSPGSRADPSEVFLQSISGTLNGLAEEVQLNLTPEEKILDASNSDDGNHVLATCMRNPAVPTGPFNYLSLPHANADFVELGVQPGDIVRYYVKVDAEAAERGLTERSYFSLEVRRLSQSNPRTALIVYPGLTGPQLEAQRMEIWRSSDKRINEIRSTLRRYETRRRPRAGWEPSPDGGALEQLTERANRWLRNQPTADDHWQADPLIKTLPTPLMRPPAGVNPDVFARGLESAAEAVSPKALRAGEFADHEGRMLQQAIWCRDISMWAKSGAVADREVARNLFDWTVRNIQLERPGDAPFIRQPWQALLYGRGTAEQRAWVFVELCRQQKIPALLLATAASADDPAEFWLVAAAVEEELHLFDPRLGMPIPSGDVNGDSDEGGESETATLTEVVADPELLDGLSITTDDGEELTYPVDYKRLGQVEAWVVADALQLSRRARLLEEALEGEAFVRLTANPQELAERLKNHDSIGKVSLWVEPFEAIVDRWTVGEAVRQQAVLAFIPFAYHPLLWKGRVLHFQGNKPPPAKQRGSGLETPRDGHRDALRAYQNREVRPPDKDLDQMEPARRMIDVPTKQNAGYWLGLLLFDGERYEVAQRWLDDRTLSAYPEGPWARGARYNLSRTYEALGDVEQAVELLQASSDGDPQRHGNLLRARRLINTAATAAPSP